MSKTVRIAGKEYRRKHISEIVVGRDMAAIMRNKEMCVFNSGIIYLKLDNGAVKKYYVGQGENNEFNMVFYDTGVNAEQRIFFRDEVMNMQWVSVFVYLFDEDEGVYMLYAERSTINTIGALYGTATTTDSFVSQMALNIASLIESTLLREILDMELRPNKPEVSLITESR